MMFHMKWRSSHMTFMNFLTFSLWNWTVPFVNTPVIINNPYLCNIVWGIFQSYLYILYCLLIRHASLFWIFFNNYICQLAAFSCGFSLQIKNWCEIEYHVSSKYRLTLCGLYKVKRQEDLIYHTMYKRFYPHCPI